MTGDSIFGSVIKYNKNVTKYNKNIGRFNNNLGVTLHTKI